MSIQHLEAAFENLYSGLHLMIQEAKDMLFKEKKSYFEKAKELVGVIEADLNDTFFDLE